MRRLAALCIPAAILLTAAPASADEAKPAETGSAETGSSMVAPDGKPADMGDVFVNFSGVRVDGETVHRIPRGRVSTLLLEVYNPHEEAVTDVVVTFLNGDGIAFPTRNAEVARIDGYGSASIEVEVQVAERAECADDGQAPVTTSSSRGSSETVMWLPIACPGPRLYQSQVEFLGGDGDGIPEPGERLEVWVSYGNWGVDPATNMRGTLTISSEDVTVITGTATWPTIPPDGGGEGGQATKQLAPFIIQIADDAETVDNGCGGYGGGVVVEDMPADDGGTGSSGGGSVSSDGTTTGGGADGSTPTEPQQVEPAPAQDPDAPTSSEADMEAAEREARAEDERRAEMPAEDPYYGEPEPSDPSVMFDGTLHLEAAEVTMDDYIGSSPVCMLADGVAGSGGNARDLDESGVGAPESADVDLTAAAGADDGTSGGSGTAALAAAFLAGIATTAWFVLRRKVLAAQR